jgi:hypothetical protein
MEEYLILSLPELEYFFVSLDISVISLAFKVFFIFHLSCFSEELISILISAFPILCHTETVRT